MEAFNSGDLNALSQLYTDNIFNANGPVGPRGQFETFVGKEETLENDAEAIAANAQVTVTNTVVIGDTVRAHFPYVDDDTLALGLELTGVADLRVERGQITSFVITFSEQTQQQLAGLFALPPAPPGPPPQAGEIVFTAFDPEGEQGHRFSGPDSLPAGWTTLRFENESVAPHHIVLLKLADGKTAQDFTDFLQQGPPEAPPDWIQSAGGVGAIFPGGSAVATVNLQEGNYILVCFVDDHFLEGMVRPLTVTAAVEPAAAEPDAAVTINMADYSFSMSGPITPGVNTIRVNNNGEEDHEAQLLQFAPDVSVEDFLAAFGAGEPEGPPPGAPNGGLNAIQVGGHGYFTVLFTPGNYVLICFVSDETGVPHVEKGMVLTFTVAE